MSSLETLKEATEVTKETEEVEECAICCDKLDSKYETIELKCGHKFHYECIFESFKAASQLNRYTNKIRDCPYCRAKSNYLPLKEGMVPMRGIHEEYSFLKGKTVNLSVIREKYFLKDKCQSIILTGANKHQQCSRKISKKSETNECAIHSRKKTPMKKFIYFPM